MSQKLHILQTAMRLAQTTRYDKLTRIDVAAAAACATGSVSYYFGSMEGLQSAMIEYSVETGAHQLVAEAIVDKHPAVSGLSVEERKEALLALV